MWKPFKRTQVEHSTSAPPAQSEIVITREYFAEMLANLQHERKPPFSRDEWHLATVDIPDDWDAAFEMAAWANCFAVIVSMIAHEKPGRDEARKVAIAIAEHWKAIEKGDSIIATLLCEMVATDPLPPDHAVFQRPECAQYSVHALAFGRANAFLKVVTVPQRQRLEFLSRLGRCLMYSSHCASVRFGSIVENLRFVESDEDVVAAHRAQAT